MEYFVILPGGSGLGRRSARSDGGGSMRVLLRKGWNSIP